MIKPDEALGDWCNRRDSARRLLEHGDRRLNLLLHIVVDVGVEPDDGWRDVDVEDDCADEDLGCEVLGAFDELRDDEVWRDVKDKRRGDGDGHWLRSVQVCLARAWVDALGPIL